MQANNNMVEFYIKRFTDIGGDFHIQACARDDDKPFEWLNWWVEQIHHAGHEFADSGFVFLTAEWDTCAVIKIDGVMAEFSDVVKDAITGAVIFTKEKNRAKRDGYALVDLMPKQPTQRGLFDND